MAEPIIELKGVSKSFGGNVVLDRVDLTIYKGEALAIIECFVAVSAMHIQ